MGQYTFLGTLPIWALFPLGALGPSRHSALRGTWTFRALCPLVHFALWGLLPSSAFCPLEPSAHLSFLPFDTLYFSGALCPSGHSAILCTLPPWAISEFGLFAFQDTVPFGALYHSKYFGLQRTLPLRVVTLWRTFHFGLFAHLGSLPFEVIGTFRLLGTLFFPYCRQLGLKGLQSCIKGAFIFFVGKRSGREGGDFQMSKHVHL